MSFVVSLSSFVNISPAAPALHFRPRHRSRLTHDHIDNTLSDTNANPHPRKKLSTFQLTMKVATIFPVFLLSLFNFTTADVNYDNQVVCGKKFPRINGAISTFCQKGTDGVLTNDLICPSIYAETGYQFTGLGGNQIRIKVTGHCNPQQWIPAHYCLSQFYDLCAKTTDPHGYGRRQYGNSACQGFVIEAA